MKLTLNASTGIDVVVWRDGETFHARRADQATEPQICLGVDLFEVIAELAGLDLDNRSGAGEAVQLADNARQRLRDTDHDGRPAKDPSRGPKDPSNEEDTRRSS